jgi:glycosyltransferase involved in cell wall biosynthesis
MMPVVAGAGGRGRVRAVCAEVELWIPANDVADPRVTIVVPCLNEEITIGDFVEWCKIGLSRLDVPGEILIVDSSTDRSAEIALAHGARVLKTPRRGLGRAYIDAVPHVRGAYVIMGDCDMTYDFRELRPFVDKMKIGFEYVMGSRFTGYIEPGAMPPLHQYFGTPVTTWILNAIYSTRYTDIHCGMRAITADALRRLSLQSQSWEYASELIIKSVHLKLRSTEVPIRFLKSPEGRESHLAVRGGWLMPWKAAWISLRIQLFFGVDFFLYKPGIAILLLGLLITVPTTWGPVRLGPVTLSLYWKLLGMILFVIGLQLAYMGILARVFYDYWGDEIQKWLRHFRYDRAIIVSAAAFCLGLAMAAPLVWHYVRNHLSLEATPQPSSYLAITGLASMIAAFMTFSFCLLLHAFKNVKSWNSSAFVDTVAPRGGR